MCEGRKTESGDSREPADEAQSESAALRTREDIQRLLVGLREDCAAIERAKAWLDKQPPDPMVHLLNREPGRSPEQPEATKPAASGAVRLPDLRKLAEEALRRPSRGQSDEQKRNLIRAQMELLGHDPEEETP